MIEKDLYLTSKELGREERKKEGRSWANKALWFGKSNRIKSVSREGVVKCLLGDQKHFKVSIKLHESQ